MWTSRLLDARAGRSKAAGKVRSLAAMRRSRYTTPRSVAVAALRRPAAGRLRRPTADRLHCRAAPRRAALLRAAPLNKTATRARLLPPHVVRVGQHLNSPTY